MSRSVFPRDDSAIAHCLPKSVKEPPAGPAGFTKSSTTAFASSTCATGIASGCSRATATISRRALRRWPRPSRASTSEELRRRRPRARSATAFGAIWPWRRVAVKLTRHCPEVERRAPAGGIIVVALETPERSQRASLSAELHDGAVGAEQMRTAAEILDLVVRIGKCGIVGSAPEIFLTECAGGTTGQPCCQPCRTMRAWLVGTLPIETLFPLSSPPARAGGGVFTARSSHPRPPRHHQR